MRNLLNVTFDLDHIICYDEADGWGSAEPYLWPVFFKIDGSTCWLNDSLMLEGTATVFTTNGSHANLSSNDVDEGETVNIPSSVGHQGMTLTPIPVPDWVKASGTDDVTAIAGCIVILMEEDNVTDDGANEGYRSLGTAVQNALDGIIPTLGVSNTSISDGDIDAMTEQIKSRVKDAIKNQQNLFENIWSWLNPDDTIGSVVWKFSGDDLLADRSKTLKKRWPNEEERSSDNGDWELFGSVTTEEIEACPADTLQIFIDALFGKATSAKSIKSMHDFKREDMSKYKGLYTWWNIALNNTVYLKYALKDKEFSQAAIKIFNDIPEILSNRDKPLSEEHFNCGITVLNHLAAINKNDRQARKGIKRSIDALHMLKGKSINHIFETLAVVKPSRYPSINTLEPNLKLKKVKTNSKK